MTQYNLVILLSFGYFFLIHAFKLINAFLNYKWIICLKTEILKNDDGHDEFDPIQQVKLHR